MLASLQSTTENSNPNQNNKKQKQEQELNSCNNYMKLQLRLLKQFHLSLLSPKINPGSPSRSLSKLPADILALLPALLSSRSAEVLCKCMEFVGAASLYSLEMNEEISNDEEIVKKLISGLAYWKKRKILFAACNAVLDMATTSFGRQRLIDCSALNNIMFLNLQNNLR